MTTTTVPELGVKLPTPRKKKPVDIATPTPTPTPTLVEHKLPAEWKTGSARVNLDQLLDIPQNATLCGLQRICDDQFVVNYVAPADAPPQFYTHRWISVTNGHVVPDGHTIVGFAHRRPVSPSRYAEPKAGQYALCIAPNKPPPEPYGYWLDF